MLVVPPLPKRGAYSLLPTADGKPVSGLSAYLSIQLVDSIFPTMPHLFVLDTGTACSGISLAKAERLGLLRDSDRLIKLRVGTASQEPKLQQVRIGRLAARIPNLRSEPFDWPVIFYPEWPGTRPLLLGLMGVVNDLTFHIDGTPGSISNFGSVTITLRDRPPPAS